MKIVMQFLIGVSFVAIAACGGSGGSGGDDEVAAVNDNPCGTVVDIGPNSIVDGVLETGDCRVTDLVPTDNDTSFADEYRVTLNATGTLTINMRSASIDSFLVLLDRSTSCSNGCTPAELMLITVDDDSGGGVNGFDALISMDLAPGSYIIVANSVDPQTGNYTLETTFAEVTIVGIPICDDFGGLGDYGCRIVPPGAPPDIGLTITDTTESIVVDIEIDNMQHIELIDSDGNLETIAVAIFVTNNAPVDVSVSMTIELTDENGSVIDSFGTVSASVFPFTPGFSGLVAFNANLDIQTLTPVIYHGVRLKVSSTGGPVTFGNFIQVNIFEVDQTSTVGG